MADQIGITHPHLRRRKWTQCLERLELFFPANSHTDAGKQKSIFHTAIGPTAYKRLNSLISPDKPGKNHYFQLVEIMKAHYSLTPSEIVEIMPTIAYCLTVGNSGHYFLYYSV